MENNKMENQVTKSCQNYMEVKYLEKCFTYEVGR